MLERRFKESLVKPRKEGFLKNTDTTVYTKRGEESSGWVTGHRVPPPTYPDENGERVNLIGQFLFWYQEPFFTTDYKGSVSTLKPTELLYRRLTLH